MSKAKGRKSKKGGGRWKVSPVWLKWDKERQTYDKLLSDLDKSTAPGGEKWREGMKRHYNKLLSEIMEREPSKYL